MKKNKKKVLIFFQSIAEITSIIQLLKKYSFSDCSIIITGGPHFIKVIKELRIQKKFGANIFFFHGLSLKNPLNFIKMYIRVYHSNDSIILQKQAFDKAFFFSEYEDFITPIFLGILNINKIFLIDNYRNVFSKKKFKTNIKDTFKKYLLSLLHIHINSKISLRRFKYSPSKNDSSIYFTFFKLKGIKIFKLKPIKMNSLSDFKLKIENKILKNKNFLYLDSNDEEMVGSEFKFVTNNLFNYFKKIGYNVIIKKPTRENLSPCLNNNMKFKYISNPIPIEMYDLNKFQFICGFMTTGLSKISERYKKIKVFSIINLLSKNKQKQFENVIYNFHKNLKTKKAKIFYPSNFDEIRKMVNYKK